MQEAARERILATAQQCIISPRETMNPVLKILLPWNVSVRCNCFPWVGNDHSKSSSDDSHEMLLRSYLFIFPHRGRDVWGSWYLTRPSQDPQEVLSVTEII